MPLAQMQVLDERPGPRATLVRFLSEWEGDRSDRATKQTLHAVTQWRRYSELFTNDGATESFSLDIPPAGDT